MSSRALSPKPGYGAILQVSEAESAMREHRIRRTKTVCTYCGVGCSFDVWTKDRHILKIEPGAWPDQRHFHLHQRQIRLGFRQQPRPADLATHSRRRQIPQGDAGTKRSTLVAQQFSEIKADGRSGFAGLHLLFEMHERRKLSHAKVGAGGRWHQ